MDPGTMALIGAGVSAAAPLFGNMFGGGGEGLKKKKTMSPEQMQLHRSRISQAMGLEGQGGGYSSALQILQQMLNPQSDVYNSFEAPYRREFEEQTIPNLAERFAGMGAQGGALSSSAFGQALGAAGAGLQEKLAYLKSGLQQSAIERLMNQYNTLSQGALSTPEFAFYNKQGGGNPITGAANSFMQNMTPGSWQSLSNMFQGSPQVGGGYGMSNFSPGGMANYENMMNQAMNFRT